MEGVMLAAVLAKIAELEDGSTARTDFGRLRMETNLQAHILVEAVDELIGLRCITAERAPGGNPYGVLALTPLARKWFEAEGKQMLTVFTQFPPRLQNSAPERSPRRRKEARA